MVESVFASSEVWVAGTGDAIGFYRANGFELVRRTDGAANDGREPDALYARVA